MGRLVLYASPGLSHLIPMVEFAKLLLHTHSHTSITFLLPTLPSNTSYSSYISSISSTYPSITFHFLPTVPLLLGDPSNYPDVEAVVFETLRNQNSNVHDALQSLSLSSPISAFILDFFCYPALDIARSLNIPSYFLFTSGACALALFLNFPVFDKIASGISYRNNLRMSFEIPGLLSITASQMLEPMLDGGVSYSDFVNLGATMARSDGIIINTFDALEPRAVMGLKEGTCLPATPVPPIYCTGPLMAENSDSSNQSEEGGDDQRHECLSWLDSQPSQSVVYLGFGNYGCFSVEQLREIALGLERSGVRFLWVVRAPPSEDKAKWFLSPPEPDLDLLLPEGFLARTKDRGLVVKSWVPQVAVLRHESVGGFVTHCGWSSVLEAILAGVPMVAWPLYAEQRFNKVVLVRETKIALPMNESDDRFVSMDEVEWRVKQVLDSEEGDAVRKQVLELKHKAMAALSEGGSAEVALSQFVESWKQ